MSNIIETAFRCAEQLDDIVTLPNFGDSYRIPIEYVEKHSLEVGDIITIPTKLLVCASRQPYKSPLPFLWVEVQSGDETFAYRLFPTIFFRTLYEVDENGKQIHRRRTNGPVSLYFQRFKSFDDAFDTLKGVQIEVVAKKEFLCKDPDTQRLHMRPLYFFDFRQK